MQVKSVQHEPFMQSGGAKVAFLGEAFRKDTPLFNVAIGDTDDNRQAELDGVGKRVAQSSAFGLEFTEFVEDHEFRFGFERFGDQGAGFR